MDHSLLPNDRLENERCCLTGSNVFFVRNPRVLLFFIFFLFIGLFAFGQGKYPPSLGADFHQMKRQALRDSMPDSSVAVLFSAPVKPRSADVDHEYVPDKDLYYFTGSREPNSMILVFSEKVRIDSVKTDELFFVPPYDPQEAIWEGKALGIAGTEDSLGVTTARSNKEFATTDIDFSRFQHIYWLNDKAGFIDDKKAKGDLASLIRHFKRKTRNLEERMNYKELHRWINSMREVKSEREIEFLRKAIDITCEAHEEAMRVMEPGIYEYQIEAVVEYWFRNNGCSGAGFPSIIGSGPNACVLHYNRNGDSIRADHLVVCDIGGEYGEYSADITRTLPANGKFSEEQKAIYALVLKAQQAAIEQCEAGNKFWEPHEVAQRIIARGLVELGITESRMGFRKYFMHGTSHYLGLDVHDKGSHGKLMEGTVLTVEPGIYIPEGSDCDKKWWNIGVRIEDDILVTEEGPENLSGHAPKTIEEVERMMEERSFFDILDKESND